MRFVGNEDYSAMGKKVHLHTDIPKPCILVNLNKSLSVPEMKNCCVADSDSVPVGMRWRLSVALRDYLFLCDLPGERLFLGAGKAVRPEVKCPQRDELNLVMT